MIGFESEFPTAIEQISPTNWVLKADVVYHGSEETIVAPSGFVTDLASVPRPLQALFPAFGLYSAPAVVHDYAWRVLAPAGFIRYRDADGLLRQAMKTVGVGPRRHVIWAAVRWGALLTRKNGWRGWHKDAVRVVAISILALPFAVLAGVGALPGLIALWLSDRL